MYINKQINKGSKNPCNLYVSYRLLQIFIISVFFTGQVEAQNLIETPETFFGKATPVNASVSDDFHEGYAIIRKGENFALIDKSGKFFVPYGTYKFNKLQAFEIDKDKCGFHNGMCAVRDPNSEAYGFIDITGKLIVPCTLLDVSPYLEDGFAWAKQKDAMGREEQVYIDKKGIKYRLKNQSLYNHNMLQAYYNPAGNRVNEFYNKKGQLLFKTTRWFKDGYSEGLIRVDTNYQLAGDKSGYMDLTGRLVVPYQFKGRLYAFHDGLAQYDPPTSDEFKYIYLNKKGEPAIKLHSTSTFNDIFFGNAPFSNGYAVGMNGGKYIVLDKNGNMNYISDMIEHNNPGFTSKFVSVEVLNDNSLNRDGNYIKFEAVLTYQVSTKFVTGGLNGGQTIDKLENRSVHGMGIADLTGRIIIPPIYTRVGFFDEISGLAKVTYSVIRQNRETSFEGYASPAQIFALSITN